MGQDLPEVSRLIKRLRRKIRIDLVLAFGSRVQDDHLLDSDVDLVIVSPDFEGRFFTERSEQVLRLWNGKMPLDTICLTPKEFRESRQRIGIVREAVRRGVPLYP